MNEDVIKYKYLTQISVLTLHLFYKKSSKRFTSICSKGLLKRYISMCTQRQRQKLMSILKESFILGAF